MLASPTLATTAGSTLRPSLLASWNFSNFNPSHTAKPPSLERPSPSEVLVALVSAALVELCQGLVFVARVRVALATTDSLPIFFLFFLVVHVWLLVHVQGQTPVKKFFISTRGVLRSASWSWLICPRCLLLFRFGHPALHSVSPGIWSLAQVWLASPTTHGISAPSLLRLCLVYQPFSEVYQVFYSVSVLSTHFIRFAFKRSVAQAISPATNFPSRSAGSLCCHQPMMLARSVAPRPSQQDYLALLSSHAITCWSVITSRFTVLLTGQDWWRLVRVLIWATGAQVTLV